MSDHPEVAVKMHPTQWATVLRQLLQGYAVVERRVRRDVKAGRMRPSEGAMWLADITMATRPITEALSEAVTVHPQWQRWVEDLLEVPTP